MKKLLGIIVLGLLLSGNAYAENPSSYLRLKCYSQDRSHVAQVIIQTKNGKLFGVLKGYKATVKDTGYEYIVQNKTAHIIIDKPHLKMARYFTGQFGKSKWSAFPHDCVVLTNIKAKPKKKKPKSNPDDNKVVPAASGTGFVVSRDGHIITNFHVIEGCNLVNIHFKGKKVEAKTLAVDKMNDIAIIKANINQKTFLPVSNEDVSLLEDVVVAGYPLGKKVSSAIKTHKGVVTSLAGAGDNYSNFQTDAAINQGNSGGPILDQKGNVVGIAVATWVEEGVQGVHFGIKSSTLKTFANSNGLKFRPANTNILTNKNLGSLITETTVYIECHMTIAKIKKMRAAANNQKAFFSEYR